MIADPIEETFPFVGHTEFLEAGGEARLRAPRAQNSARSVSQALGRASRGDSRRLRRARLGLRAPPNRSVGGAGAARAASASRWPRADDESLERLTMFGLPLAFAAPPFWPPSLCSRRSISSEVTPPRPRQAVPAAAAAARPQSQGCDAGQDAVAVAGAADRDRRGGHSGDGRTDLESRAPPAWRRRPVAAVDRRRLAGGAVLGARASRSRATRSRGATRAGRLGRAADVGRRARRHSARRPRASKDCARWRRFPMRRRATATLPAIERFLAANPNGRDSLDRRRRRTRRRRRLRARLGGGRPRPHCFRRQRPRDAASARRRRQSRRGARRRI